MKKKSMFRLVPIQFNEGRVDNAIQVMKTGKFFHDFFGEFEVTVDMFKNMIKNFEANVVGTDIALDYAHQSGLKAAAWFTNLYLGGFNQDELWAEVAWTDPAKLSVDNKEWRYISAEFHEDYEDNETRKTFGPTLLGAGLTNRPFLKGMAPAVALSEQNNNQKQGDSNMPQEQLVELQKLQTKTFTDKVHAESEVASWKVLGENPQAVSKKLSDLEVKVTELSKEVEDNKKASLDIARQTKFDALMKSGKVVKAQEGFIKSLSDEQLVEFEKNAGVTTETNTENKGSGNDNEDVKSSGDVQDQITELAQKAMEGDKTLDIGAATSLVLSNPKNKTLADKYEELEG